MVTESFDFCHSNDICVAVQTISKPEIYRGVEFKLRADVRVRVHKPLQICLGAGAKVEE